MTVKVSEEGLVIPKEFLAGMDEVEIRREQNFVVVGPAKIGSLLLSEAELLAEYQAMAADEEHEREALEWCEGLIGDGFLAEK